MGCCGRWDGHTNETQQGLARPISLGPVCVRLPADVAVYLEQRNSDETFRQLDATHGMTLLVLGH